MLNRECLAELRAALGQYEAETILLHCLQQEARSYLFTHDTDVVSDAVLIMARNILRRRLESVPLAYILGYCYFYDLKLALNRNCLVPRPDTELLVDVAFGKLQDLQGLTQNQKQDQKRNQVRCLDLGTGSGAIILALKDQYAQMYGVGLDVCEKALAVAQSNGERLGLPIEWLQGQWAEAIATESFDCIVSNPPYIAYSELCHMNAETGAEPAKALFAPAHGLADYRTILQQAYRCLKPNGWLCVEHGFQQAAALAELFAEHGFVSIQQFKDYGGHDRVTIGQKLMSVLNV